MTKEDDSWKVLVLLLKEIAIEKHGHGWQTFLADNTPFAQSNISRMFGLKILPNFAELYHYCKSIKNEFLPRRSRK